MNVLLNNQCHKLDEVKKYESDFKRTSDDSTN